MYKNINLDDLYIRKDNIFNEDEYNNIDSLSNNIRNNCLINSISVRENEKF